MLKMCEIDIINESIRQSFVKIEDFQKLRIKSHFRDGDENLYYLTVELSDNIDFNLIKWRRFEVIFFVNSKLHPINVTIRSPNEVEIEKWDKREILPEDEKYVSISVDRAAEY